MKAASILDERIRSVRRAIRDRQPLQQRIDLVRALVAKRRGTSPARRPGDGL